MSRYFSLLLCALVMLGVVACGDDGNDTSSAAGAGDDSDQISVVATTAPIGALVNEIAGDEVELHVLMESGVDPHDFEVTPADIRTMSEADLILRNGVGLDDFLDDSIEAAGGDVDVITVTDGIDLIEGGHAHDHEDEHDDHDDEDEHAHEDEHDAHGEDDEHGEFDSHVWHDPANAKVMVDNIASALSTTAPSVADVFGENAETYKAVLDETDAKIRAMIDEIPEENRKLVTSHDAFGYFIQAYDLEFVGAVIPSTSTDAEPSAQQVAELSKLIEQENIQAIFAEASADPRIAEQLSSDTGVQIVYGLYSDSLGEPGTDAATVHGMLLANATAISEALK